MYSAVTVGHERNHLFIPLLAPLYASLEPFGYAIMRLTSGCIMADLGWMKLFGNGMQRDIQLFQKLGLEPAVPLAYFTSGLEFFGGLAIAIGLLTRPLAVMFCVEMMVILALVMIPRGTGYHLSVVWLGVFFFLLLRGGGRISVDHLIGREF
jgi:putative oxidoreductase